MGLLRKWKRKRALSSIPLDLIYETLYITLKTFNEDIPLIRLSKKRHAAKGKVPIKKKSISPKEKEAYIVKTPILKNTRVRKNIFYKSQFRRIYDATYKVVLFGDLDTGKSSLTQRFLTKLFKSDVKMTIGVDFEVKSLEINGKKVKLQIWDFVGEERFRFLLPTYVRGANGALFIFNVENPSSLAHIDDWLLVVRREIKSEQEAFPIVVVGIVPESEEERQVPSEEAIKIAKSRKVEGYIECSPITGENVEETFDAITRLMLKRSRMII